jgi:hypothetical protein
MNKQRRILGWALSAVTAIVVVLGSAGAAGQGATEGKPQQALAAPLSDQDLATMQDQLLQLLRTSPKLTTVVARDPSLLADQEYVTRNNPQLAQFLVQHPEIARNPDYYLFTHLDSRGGRRDQALERAVWPDQNDNNGVPFNPNLHEVVGDVAGVLAFGSFLTALFWLVRQFLENRRWSRIFKLQSEVHGRLIEKFNSPQEIAAYMETEAGKRFLEAAPIPVSFEPEQRMPNAVARVLWPLQIGIVLVLLGSGLLFLRSASPDMNIPMLVVGTVVLMPGIGFIISAGITWVLAGRLGLLPDSASAASTTNGRGTHQDGL